MRIFESYKKHAHTQTQKKCSRISDNMLLGDNYIYLNTIVD